MKAQLNRAILGLVFGAAVLGVSQLQADPPQTPSRVDEDAGPAEGMGPGRHGPRLGRIAQMLGLNKDQVERGRALHETMRDKVKPILEQLQDKHAELELLWRAANPDKAAILAKMTELDALQSKVREARVDFRLGMQLVLTPVQRIKAEEMLRNRRGGRQGHGFGRPRFMDGPGFRGGD